MPNTLAHIGINGLLSRTLIKQSDFLLIYIGAIIPDIPWILQRTATFTFPNINLYDLRLYCIIQSTLFFSLILSAASAMILSKSQKSFLILSLGSFIHLAFDSVETKWANGVHFFAPFNWDLFNAGIFWPGNKIVHLLSIFGLIYFFTFWKKSLVAMVQLDLNNKRKLSVFLLIIFSYIFLPVVFMQNAEDADNHFVKTLRNSNDREAKYFEIDRGKYVDSKDGDTFLTPFDETLLVKNMDLNRSEILSIRAKFISKNEIQIIEYHIHGNRDMYSYAGLFFILIVMLYRIFFSAFPKKVKFSSPI